MGKFTEFKLQLKSMPEGEHEYAYHLGKEFLSTWKTMRSTTPTST